MKRVALTTICFLLAMGGLARAGIRAESEALVEVVALLDAYAKAETSSDRAEREYRRQVARLQEASRRVNEAVVANESPSRVAQTLKKTAGIHYEVIQASGQVVFTKDAYKVLLQFEKQFRRVGEKFTYYSATPFKGYR